MLHEIIEDSGWLKLYKQADNVVVFGRKEKTKLEYEGIENVYVQSSLNDFSIKKMYFDLLDSVHYMFECKKFDKILNSGLAVIWALAAILNVIAL